MKVRVISETGEERIGNVSFSKCRGKSTVFVIFNEPIKVPYPTPGTFKMSYGEEFYLKEFNCAINVWGQGTEFPNYAWKLHPDDAAEIVATGGG